MLDYIGSRPIEDAPELVISIGLHCALVLSLSAKKRFPKITGRYVNIARLVKSNRIPNLIQVSAYFYNKECHQFVFFIQR